MSGNFFMHETLGNYSHLSNKREVTFTDFEKFLSPQKKIPPPQNRFFLKLHKNYLS